jgi:TolB protein
MTRFAFGALSALAPLALLALASTAQGAGAQDEGPLPQLANDRSADVSEIDVSGAARALFKMAVVPSESEQGKTAADVMSRDFQLSSLVEVLDPRSFKADLVAEGATINDRSWREVGAEYVVKTQVDAGKITFRLYAVGSSKDAKLTKSYDAPKDGVRSVTHQFVNEAIKFLTGQPGGFGGRLVFSARTEKGKRGLFIIDADGANLGRLPAPQDVAQAPAFGPGGIYYSGIQANGSYALFKVGNPAPVFEQPGLVLGAAFSSKRMAVVVASGGRSDVFRGELGAKELPRLTTQGSGLATHPSFSPDGRVAWASDMGGTQQIYVEGKRVTWRGKENMAPTWCNTPQGLRILFMGREGGAWDIFSIDPDGGNLQRLTQGQGSNKYPACSPDGRMIAFFSSRGGLFIANPQGLNQQLVAKVEGESLRWEP